VGSEKGSRSKLLPLGFALMIMGIAFPGAITGLTEGLDPGAPRTILEVLVRVLYAGFLIGLGVAILGILKNRRALKP
jgi:hypothetical protein